MIRAIALLCFFLGFGVVSADDISDVTGRTRVPCAPGKLRDLVIVPLGQSNAASHGQAPYRPSGDVVNFSWLDNQCYVAEDPLLGATGAPGRGSIWSHLGDKLLATNKWDRIVVAPIAVGGSSVAEWAPGGQMWPRIPGVVKGLRAAKLEPDMFLWIQGEVDASVRADSVAYKKNFMALVGAIRKEVRTRAPIFVAVSTLCYGNDTGPVLEEVDPDTRVLKWIGREAIQRAQREVVSPELGIYPGPNLDFIGITQRWDGCHLSSYGLNVAADMWKQRILAPRQ